MIHSEMLPYIMFVGAAIANVWLQSTRKLPRPC